MTSLRTLTEQVEAKWPDAKPKYLAYAELSKEWLLTSQPYPGEAIDEETATALYEACWVKWIQSRCYNIQIHADDTVKLQSINSSASFKWVQTGPTLIEALAAAMLSLPKEVEGD